MHDILEDVFNDLKNLIDSSGDKAIKIYICVGDICDL
jgi:hypothetical protein